MAEQGEVTLAEIIHVGPKKVRVTCTYFMRNWSVQNIPPAFRVKGRKVPLRWDTVGNYTGPIFAGIHPG